MSLNPTNSVVYIQDTYLTPYVSVYAGTYAYVTFSYVSHTMCFCMYIYISYTMLNIYITQCYVRIIYCDNCCTSTDSVIIQLWGLMHNTRVNGQKAAGTSTGSLDHIRQIDTGTGKVESFILFSCAQRCGGTNNREGPLKCNLLLVFCSSGGVCRSAPAETTTPTSVSLCPSMCEGVKYWLRMPIYFFGVILCSLTSV